MAICYGAGDVPSGMETDGFCLTVANHVNPAMENFASHKPLGMRMTAHAQ